MKTPIKIYIVSLVASAGLVTGCNQSIESASQDYNSLPTAVQRAVRAQSPNGEITSISKTSENGIEAYKVEFRKEGGNSTMVVAFDGRVLSSDMPMKQDGVVQGVKKALTPTGAVGTKFSALPENVQKTILAHAPQADISDITRHEDNGRVIYEVSFKDSAKYPGIRVDGDGSLVQDLPK
jgi:uncharacterized membrane protein YkoI